MGSARKTVLISEPQGITGELQFDNANPYLPYMWAILKSHWERNCTEDNTYEWLDPIWWNDMPELLLEPYRGQTIDVLGLSCYTWNWYVQCKIAAMVKADNPECLVIAGGPEPDYKDPEFFNKHPYIDMVAVKDGEITFSKILAKLARQDRNFLDVGGLYMPGNNGRHVHTGPAEVPLVFDYSPYVEQTDYYERLIKQHKGFCFDVIIETNRGCPYGCSFCDWGSNTMSKIRRFDMSRIKAEIEWLGRMNVSCIMLADANFGIFPRDVEIADLLNATREKYHGYPKYIFYSAAKNNPDRVIAIAKKFSQSGICTSHALSIQHTRPEVLAATERSNISSEKQIEVVRTMIESHVPIEVQLILGIPGDTYELWKNCLADLMEWGIHEDYLIQPYRLLPNAPASEKSFIDKWQIKWIERVMFDQTLRDVNPKSRDVLRKQERVVVESATFSQADWVKMATYSAFVKALHNGSLTQRIAVYLRLTHQVSYFEFYSDLIENGLNCDGISRDFLQAVTEHYQQFQITENASDHMELKSLSGLPYLLHPSRWLYVQICLNLDAFFRMLKRYLLDKYPFGANLAAVIDYQKELIILPAFECNHGKTFQVDFDFMGYFQQARARNGAEYLPEPGRAPGTMVHVSDRNCGERGGGGFYSQALDWSSDSQEERWAKWIERIVLGRSSAAMHNFQQFKMEHPILS
jgi:putative methyltransferase